jgi:hypothetical protein
VDHPKDWVWGDYPEILRIPEQSYHPFRFIVTTDSAAL